MEQAQPSVHFEAESGESRIQSFLSPRLDEKVPLLPNKNTSQRLKRSKTTEAYDSVESMGDQGTDLFKNRKVEDVFVFDHTDKMVYYDHEALGSFKCFALVCRSAFMQRPVIHAFASTLCVSFISAAILVLFVPHSNRLDTTRFSYFCTYLKVFISFMLGLYIQQAFKRWWYAVSTYEKFHISVRQLIFLLHCIKLPTPMINIFEDYCLASSYILSLEVANAQSNHGDPAAELLKRLKWLKKQGFILHEEVEYLSRMSEVSVLAATRSIWTWIGEFMIDVKTENGSALPPPMQVRLFALCQQCIGEIENLKLSIIMQVPFTYAHLLSLLVHVNNLLMGITCGLSLGSALVEAMLRREQMNGGKKSTLTYSEEMREFYEAMQVTGVQFLILMVEPMLYMAFLHIAHLLSYPFGDESYHIPLETFVARLHQEFNSMTENRDYFREHLKGRPREAQNVSVVLQREKSNKKDDIEQGEIDGDDDDGD